MQARLYCILILATLGFSINSNAQGGFKRFHHLHGSLGSIATDVIETPDQKYLIAGRTYADINGTTVSQLTFLLTDLNGDTIRSRRYGSPALHYPDYLQRNRFFCADSDHVFVTVTATDVSGNLFPVLLKLNYQGDTLWQKVYPVDPIANVIPQVLVKARDCGFYLCGTYQIHGAGRPVFLWRLAENGSTLWSKIIHKSAPDVMSAADMLQDQVTGKLIITGYQYIGSGTYNNLLILDSLGNKLVHKYFNDGCGTGSNVIQLRDGNYITNAKMKVDCQYAVYRNKPVKFNHLGNIIWQNLMSSYGPVNSLIPLCEKSNKEWYGIGYIDSVFIQKLKLILFDSLGNKKWAQGFGRAKDVISPDYFRAANRTPDGGFLIALQANHEPSPTPFYIIKLDSMGCDTTPQYCAWQQTVSLKEQKQLLQAEIFPNPCNDVLNIGINGSSFPAKVRVFDQSGRLLREEEAVGKKHTLAIPDLPQGLYLLEVRSTAGVFRGNFVVQR